MVNANGIGKGDAEEGLQGGVVGFRVNPAFWSRVVWVLNGKGWWFVKGEISVRNGEE